MFANFNGLGNGATEPPAIYRSSDSGCSWTRAALLQARGSHLIAGGGDYAIGWTDVVTGSIVFVTDSDGELARTTSFSSETAGMAVSNVDSNVVYRVGRDRGIFESRDRGLSWRNVGTVPLRSGGIDSVAFDERNPRRLAVGSDGMIVTNDLGATWITSTFGSNPTANIVVFSAAFSADGQTIWAHGRDIDEFAAGNANDGRHLWQSSDGGANFVSVAEQTATVKLMNFLIAHPNDPNLVFWSGGVFGDPTTHLYRYSKLDGTVTRVLLSDGTPFFDVHRFAFHPTNPSYMYFGLVWPGP